jgi:tripeptidyl-peptidase-1
MKLVQSFLVFILLITAETASVPHVVHEKRSIVPLGWKRRYEKPSATTIIPLSFALTQRNLDLGPSYLMKVSDPDSTEYGKYWSPKEVGFVTSPYAH